MSKYLLLAVACVVVLTVGGVAPTSGQESYSTGSNVAPSFEGWEENADGTFSMVFGYLNRNYDEILDIAIGPDNNVSPGPADQGQPTHFLPRRNRYVFRVRVPKDFGNKEVVWTITANGKTEKAYATLKPEYVSDARVMMINNNAGVRDSEKSINKAPIVKVEGAPKRTVKVGEPLTLTAFASDDGVPRAKPATTLAIGANGSTGLRVAWFVYRGPGTVTFDPEQFNVYVDYRPKANTPWTPGWAPPPLPPGGMIPVNVTFSAPGTYVLRVQAHDGGLDSVQDVTVTVER